MLILPLAQLTTADVGACLVATFASDRELHRIQLDRPREVTICKVEYTNLEHDT